MVAFSFPLKFSSTESFFRSRPRLFPIFCFYIYQTIPFNPSFKSLHLFLECPLLFLQSGCQFISNLHNLSFPILFTCSCHLHLFSSIFFITVVITFNRFELWYLLSCPISKFLLIVSKNSFLMLVTFFHLA